MRPPLIGSALYRGSFLSAYEFGFTFLHLNIEDDHFLKNEYLGCVRPMVPLACLFGAVVRGTIEGKQQARMYLSTPLLTFTLSYGLLFSIWQLHLNMPSLWAKRNRKQIIEMHFEGSIGK